MDNRRKEAEAALMAIESLGRYPVILLDSGLFRNIIMQFTNEELQILENYFCMVHDPVKADILVQEMTRRFSLYKRPKSMSVGIRSLKKFPDIWDAIEENTSKQPGPTGYYAAGINIIHHQS